MANVKLTVAVVIAVLIVASIGSAAVLLNKDDDGKYHSNDNTGRLQVYGNATGDDYLDKDDVNLIREIIARNSDNESDHIDWRKDHPLADANCDGELDAEDVEWAEKMVNRDKMTIHYINGNNEQKSVKYPIERSVVVGSNAMLTANALGAVTAGKVVGVTGEANKDGYLFSNVKDIAKVSKSVTTANFEEVTKIEGGVDAIITMASSAYVKNEKTFTDAGYDVVRISSSDGLASASVALTLGYLYGLETRANEYARFCDKIVKTAQEKASTLSESDKVRILVGTMTNYVSGRASDYYELSVLCGGNNIADWNDVTKRYEEGQEWLKEPKYHADWFVHFRNYSYEPSTELDKIYLEYSKYYDDIQTFKDGHYVIMNGYMPAVLRMAYMAELMYPDLYGKGWADGLHQEYIDKFVDNLSEIGYKVVSSQFVITNGSLK